jgi:hypothetical protein
MLLPASEQPFSATLAPVCGKETAFFGPNAEIATFLAPRWNRGGRFGF